MQRRPDPARFAFADPARLLSETLDALLPPSRISVAEHAAQHRWVKSSTGGHLERWDPGHAPYLVEPMEALTQDGVATVAVVGPAASGKTVVAENWLLQTMHADPAELLWYLPTEPLADSYVKGRIEPMLEAHDKLLGHLRYGRDSVGFKRFRGGRAEFLAFTHSNLINKHVSRIVADEFDAYDAALGDPLVLLNARRQAAGAEGRLLLISHPDLGLPLSMPRERQRGIMAPYADSDRRTWWWACPHCNGYSSPNPGTARHMALWAPEDAPLDVVEAEARLVCPLCGAHIEDGARRAMNATGRWVAIGEEIDEEGRVAGQRRPNRIAGFWIVGAMSPFNEGIGVLARRRAAAEREAAVSGDWRSLHQVVVKTLGEPFAPPARLGSVDAAALAERAETDLRLGEVPEGVRFLTAWADAQGNRWEWLVRGWGEGGASWVVHREVVPGDPAASPHEWDALLAKLRETTFPLADGSGRRMRIRAAGFDAFGGPGVTEQAYAAWLRRRQRGLVRRLGVIEGRDAWELVPTKGADGRAAPRIALVYPNTQRKDRRVAARGQVPLLQFNPNGAKDALAAQLALAPPAEGAVVRFPAGLRDPNGPPHPFFEGLAAEQRDQVRGTWSKVSPSARNEPLDMMVGCEVVARLHGLHRIDWSRPPAWAAPWEANTGIVPADAAAAVAEAPAASPPVAAVAATDRRMPAPGPAPAAAPGLNVAALRSALLRARRPAPGAAARIR